MTQTGIIIQARVGSKRFPKKILEKIGNKNVLEHVITRVKKTKFKKKIIIATTKNKIDRKLKKIAKNYKCFFFKGNNNNVLNRLFCAADKFKIKNIIRISADSPFLDPGLIEKAYEIFKKNKLDLVTNIQYPTYPKGMSVEVFNFDTLNKARKLAISKFDKEHVTKAIYKNSKLFKIRNFFTKQKIRNLKFALDYKDEIEHFRKLYFILKKRKINNNYKLHDLIKILKKNQIFNFSFSKHS